MLEHHFDNHQFCGEWCKRKRLTAEAAAANERYYRCKTKDKALYDALLTIVGKYISFHRLKEIAHGMDTNANESINNTISYFPPKNHVYCATQSLQTRIGLAIGIVSVGFLPYFRCLFKALGITMQDNVLHYLQVRDASRKKRLDRLTMAKTKKGRMKRKFELLQQDEQDAKKQRAKQDGTYKSGGHMQSEHGFDRAEEPPKKKQKVCPHCGLKGHVTT